MEILTDVQSIKKIISELKLEEKVKFLMARTTSRSYSIPERDIPSLVLADGATGANGTHIVLDFLMEMSATGDHQSPMNLMGQLGGLVDLIGMDEKSAEVHAEDDPLKKAFLKFLNTRRNPAGAFISFPSGMNIGACFDEKAAQRIGEAVGKEMRASNISVCLGPNVDIVRDPLGGRNYEMYGEDPVLVERTAVAFIRGMQSTGTMACAKHYIANNQETNRQKKNTHVSIRTLKELYGRGFRAAVKEGGVKTIMSAYNAVNGIFSSYNKMLLTDWLKEEWGFEGMVVSDWGAITGHYDQTIAAGMDMILNGSKANDMEDVIKAVENGTLAESRIDDAIERILKLILWQKDITRNKDMVYDFEALLKCSLDTVTEGMVLLKNESVLPLSKGTKAVILGRSAKEPLECGSGSTYITTPLHTSLYEECDKVGIIVSGEENEDSEVVIYAARAEGGENADRTSMALDNEDEEHITSVLKTAKEKGKKTIVVLNIAAPVDMRTWVEYADAILCEFVPGCMGQKATAAVLAGEANPGGRLPVTFPVKLTDSPASPYTTGEYDDIYYSEGIFNGYRWYDCKEIPVQYPFGFGLSYTTFSYGAITIPEEWDLNSEDSIEIQVWVTNTGNRYGSEVVQLYFGKRDTKILMPEKELMAYGKACLEPGEKKKISLIVKKETLVVYDQQQKRSIIPIGKYRVMLGRNAQDMFFEEELNVIGDNPYVMGANSTLKEIFESEKAVQILSEYVPVVLSLPEDSKRMLANEKIGVLLERLLIGNMPNANELKAFLDKLYCELAKL